jgi:hypothetical protein
MWAGLRVMAGLVHGVELWQPGSSSWLAGDDSRAWCWVVGKDDHGTVMVCVDETLDLETCKGIVQVRFCALFTVCLMCACWQPAVG